MKLDQHQHRRAAGGRSKHPQEAEEEGEPPLVFLKATAAAAAASSSSPPAPTRRPRTFIRLLDKDDEGKARGRSLKLGTILLLLLVAAGFWFVVQDFASSSSYSSQQLQQQQQPQDQQQQQDSSIPSSSSSSSPSSLASPSAPSRTKIPLTEEAAEAFNSTLAQFLARARLENLEAPLRDQEYAGHTPEAIERVAFHYFATDAPLARLLRDVLVEVLGSSVQAVGDHSKESDGGGGEEQEGSAGSLVEIAPKHSVRGKPLHVWFTTHVPPYGYGKGHGLSGFLRILAFPTSPSSPLTQSPQALADFVRWHCRLSHVLAHTRARTLDLTDSNNIHPSALVVLLLDQLWAFLGLDPSTLDEARDMVRTKASGAWQEATTEDSGPWLPSELVDTFELEVGRMEEWPCGFFESDEWAEALRPMCETLFGSTLEHRALLLPRFLTIYPLQSRGDVSSRRCPTCHETCHYSEQILPMRPGHLPSY